MLKNIKTFGVLAHNLYLCIAIKKKICKPKFKGNFIKG